jgi:hypothetical protein
MLSQQSVYQAEIKKILQERINTAIETITNRFAVIDHSTYSYHVGIIEGLKTAIEVCDEAESECKRRGLIG